MDFSSFVRMPIIDAHVHFSDVRLMPDVLALMERTGVSQVNLVSTPHPQWINLNPQALHFKARHPDQVYLFGALDYSGVLGRADPTLTIPLADQVDRLIALGCDGIKMVEGKPSVRKQLGLAFDGEAYAGVFARAAERGLPILWHVNDPEENWDAGLIAPGAKARGWFYGDGTFLAKEELYTEVGHVLDRHPDLKVIFAHFYFLSAQLPRAAALLDRYPNVNLDITPGTEMYPNFAANFEAARELFLKYQDRVVYGTDTGAGAALDGTPHLDLDSTAKIVWMVRQSLESEGPFPIPDLPWLGHRPMLRGMALPKEVLARIYAGNFQRIVSPAPRALDMNLVNEELERIEALVEAAPPLADSVWSQWKVSKPLAI